MLGETEFPHLYYENGITYLECCWQDSLWYIYTRCLLEYSMFSVLSYYQPWVYFTYILSVTPSTRFHILAVTSLLFMPILVPSFKVHVFISVCAHTHKCTHTQLQKIVSVPFLQPSALPSAAHGNTCSSLPEGIFFLACQHSWLSCSTSWNCQKIKQLSTRTDGKLEEKSSGLLAFLGE